MGERSARGQAIDILRSGAFMEIPVPPTGCEPLSPEALQFIEDTRKPRFAALANIIDMVLERTLARDEASLVHYESTMKIGPWAQLRADINQTAAEDITALENTEAFQLAEAYTKLVGWLDPHRYNTLSGQFGQLNSGVDTSSTTMTQILRNFSGLVLKLGGGPKLDHAAMARNSVALPSRMAMASINQMMGARDAVVDKADGEPWGSIYSTLDASKYVLIPTSDGSAVVNYADFESMEVPAGWTPMRGHVDPVPEATAIKDIPSGHDETIGCPLTLLQRRLYQKWNWVIDLSLGRELWVPPHVLEEQRLAA